ncbi:MAG: hypothetical protein Q4C16_10495 [Eubacteriales bacterium]|jgi:hypothetical protein|nr:hypothetical protein [Eubacteriales bacterium]
MAVIIDDNVKAAIEAILKRGNDAIIRRKGDTVIVLEEKRKIVYSPSSSRGGGRAIGADTLT